MPTASKGISIEGAQVGNVLRSTKNRWYEVVWTGSTQVHVLPVEQDRSLPDWFKFTSLRRLHFTLLGKRVGSEEYVTRRYDSRHAAARAVLAEERETARLAYEAEKDGGS